MICFDVVFSHDDDDDMKEKKNGRKSIFHRSKQKLNIINWFTKHITLHRLSPSVPKKKVEKRKKTGQRTSYIR